MDDPPLHMAVLKAISSRRLPSLILLETLVALFAEPEESLPFRPAASGLFAYAFQRTETNHEWRILIIAVKLSRRRVDR